MTIPERVGTLRMQPSGRWAICRPGDDAVEITSGDLFRVEIEEGVLHVRRMDYAHDGRGYYADGGPELRDGMRKRLKQHAEQQLDGCKMEDL